MNFMNKEFKKYLGIDWGEKRIGLALADNEIKIAVPYKVVGTLDKIIQVIEEEKVDKIIIGQPIKMRGDKKDLSDEFNNFIKILKEAVTIPIKLVDERLSSKAADALIGDKKTKAPRDAIAAMLILQSYLDS